MWWFVFFGILSISLFIAGIKFGFQFIFPFMSYFIIFAIIHFLVFSTISGTTFNGWGYEIGLGWHAWIIERWDLSQELAYVLTVPIHVSAGLGWYYLQKIQVRYGKIKIYPGRILGYSAIAWVAFYLSRSIVFTDIFQDAYHLPHYVDTLAGVVVAIIVFGALMLFKLLERAFWTD